MIKSNIDIVYHNREYFGIDMRVVDLALAGIPPPPHKIAYTNQKDMAEAQAVAREAFPECALLLGADKRRYWKLVEDLDNSYTQSQERYPKTMAGLYKILKTGSRTQGKWSRWSYLP